MVYVSFKKKYNAYFSLNNKRLYIAFSRITRVKVRDKNTI